MAVLINFKICDNSKDCNGIRECPTGAFGWDEENKTIFVDKDLCTNCGLCEVCEVEAIKVTHTEEEYNKIKKEIDEDTRTINDLFVDRYGASPIQQAFITTEEQLDIVLQSRRPFIIELYAEDTIMCLLKSIPIKEILQAFDPNASFRKVEVKASKLIDRYNLKELPALVFVKEGELLYKIEGYYDDENSSELFERINILKNKGVFNERKT